VTDSVIVGGTGGLGLVIAQRLADRGDSLVITSRDLGRAETAAGKIGSMARDLAADLAEPGRIADALAVSTPRAYLAASLAYNLRDGIAEKIACPVFVGRGESDEFFHGQPEELMEHLTAAATLAGFTDAEGAGAHCQVGAQRLLSARMLDWLDETLG
jgi:NAD(P)-dependent dehydrogenase (short-subunit alcohol dehydrogenase family)